MLFDTHALLWWVTGDKKLSRRVRSRAQRDGAVVSVVSLWEIAVKRARRKIEVDLSELIDDIARTDGFKLLEISPRHALVYDKLQALHGDPFDRMLVAQAIAEHIPLASKDGWVSEYPVDVVW